jgi:hypothetical protein
MAARTGAVELLEGGINALAQANASRLEILAEAARWVESPQTAEEQRVARERLRALGSLLMLTRRNLRLLRATSRYELLRERGGDAGSFSE